MKKLSNLFYDKSTWLIAMGASIATFGYLYLIMIPKAAGYVQGGEDQIALATSFGFDTALVTQFLSTLSADMSALYQDFNLIWDNIFAILYGLMYTLWF